MGRIGSNNGHVNGKEQGALGERDITGKRSVIGNITMGENREINLVPSSQQKQPQLESEQPFKSLV
jgi:hypothetical protein